MKIKFVVFERTLEMIKELFHLHMKNSTLN